MLDLEIQKWKDFGNGFSYFRKFNILISNHLTVLSTLESYLPTDLCWTLQAIKQQFTYVVPLIYCPCRNQANDLWGKLAKVGHKTGHKPITLETESGLRSKIKLNYIVTIYLVVRLDYDITVAIERIKTMLV